jgi:hypothetical protein
MDRADRLRVAWVAALAVAVMAGVVASALHLRSQGGGRDPFDVAGGDDPRDRVPETPRRRGEAPLPAECEPREGFAPVAEVDLPGGRLDFGDLRQGVVVEREVPVRNRGTGLLCVTDIETGCGCVKADWVGESRIPPGGTGALKIRVDTAGREGPQDRTVVLYVNDPARRTVSFKVRLEIRLGLVVVSGGGHTVSFGTRPAGRPASLPVRIRCPKDERPWEVLGVESALAEGERTAFTWRLDPVEPAAEGSREYDLVLTHPGTTRLGPAYERIRVRTSHPERPEILLDTQVLVVPKYYAQPPKVSLLRVRREAVNTRTIFVLPGEPGATFRVKGARVEGTGFAAATPRTVPEGWAVDVRYDGAARGAGRVKATLVVEVDDAELPEVRVPLEAEVLGS